MELNRTRIDESKATEGVWVPLDGETDLLIARWLNHNHKQYVQKALDPYKRALQFGTMDEVEAERIEVAAMAEAVLLGWRGLKENGKEIAYSKKEAIRLLSDPQLVWFRDFVRDQSQEFSNFREEQLRKEVEAVGKPLSGNSTGAVKAVNS